MTEQRQFLKFLLAVTVSQTFLVCDDLDSLRNNDKVLGRLSLSWELPDNFLFKKLIIIYFFLFY